MGILPTDRLDGSTVTQHGLTPREGQVATLLAKGWPNKRIAQALGCRPRTVEAHIARIGKRLENPDRLPMRTLVLLWRLSVGALP